MSRKFFVGGNFKMNGTKNEITAIIDNLKGGKDDNLDPNVEVVLGAPFVYLETTKALVEKNGLKTVAVAAQNSSAKKNGAFTGDTSVLMLKDIGIDWVILGHSERRSVFAETDATISEKIGLALAEGLKVIACIGETKDQRVSNQTNDVIGKQMAAIKDNISDWNRVVVAYEPVWAIGTGLVATPEQAQDAHAFLRNWLTDNVSPAVSAATRILYGGSVTGANCNELAKKPDIDGFLVGGASLKPEFVQIVNARR